MELETISLDKVLPGVFASEKAAHSSSEVWLRDLTFTRGKRYLISASSGAGKSSLCAFIYGYRTDFQGTISFNGKDIRSFGEKDWDNIRRSSIAWLPQEMRLFPTLTALENVMLKASLTGYKNEAEARRMFAALGIEQHADRQARLLSIGQQQRVAVVRALCQPFTFLLLDEPVSHLDDCSNSAVAALIDEEARQQGAAVITTSVGNHLRLKPDINLSL